MIKIKNKLLAAALCAMVAASGLTVASAPAAEAATSCVNRTFSYDVQHYQVCVKYFQQMSNSVEAAKAHGYFGNASKYPTINSVVGVGHLDTDGLLGNDTKAAIKKWQKHGWYTTLGSPNAWKPMLVDGIIGKQTWNLMCELVISFSPDSDLKLRDAVGCDDAIDWSKPADPLGAQLRVGTHS